VGRNDNTDPIPPNTPGGNGLFGFTKNPHGSGVFGFNDAEGAGITGFSKNGPAVKGFGRIAGRFEGDVEVTGDVRLLGADCAEEFDATYSSDKETLEPGTVMVLNNSGNLEQSQNAYDKKVAGIVSGAGSYKPAIVLDKKDNDINTNNKRVPIALMGKVYCKVDATSSPIEIGDLLTSSSLKGHAMKAEDPYKAFGAVIGKALSSIKEGVGMIPVLVALQ